MEHHAELLDALMFPCALEEELFPSTAAAGAGAERAGAKPSGGAAGTSGSSALVAAAARRPLRPRQALDGLHATLQRAEFLKREQPMVGVEHVAGWRAPQHDQHKRRHECFLLCSTWCEPPRSASARQRGSAGAPL